MKKVEIIGKYDKICNGPFVDSDLNDINIVIYQYKNGKTQITGCPFYDPENGICSEIQNDHMGRTCSWHVEAYADSVKPSEPIRRPRRPLIWIPIE